MSSSSNNINVIIHNEKVIIVRQLIKHRSVKARTILVCHVSGAYRSVDTMKTCQNPQTSGVSGKIIEENTQPIDKY